MCARNRSIFTSYKHMAFQKFKFGTQLSVLEKAWSSPDSISESSKCKLKKTYSLTRILFSKIYKEGFILKLIVSTSNQVLLSQKFA